MSEKDTYKVMLNQKKNAFTALKTRGCYIPR